MRTKLIKLLKIKNFEDKLIYRLISRAQPKMDDRDNQTNYLSYGMKKRMLTKKCYGIITLSSFLVFANAINAQAIKDSFLRLINDPSISLTTKAEVSNKLGSFYIAGDRDSAEHYTALTKKFAYESEDKYQIVDYKLLLVTLNKDSWGKDSSASFYQDLLKDPFVRNNKTFHKTIINDLGVLYGDYGDQETAIKYAVKALEISKQMSDSIEIGRSLVNLGVGYFNMSLNELALAKFKEGAQLFNSIDHKSFEAYCYTGIINVFDNYGAIDSALYYAEKLKIIADSVNLQQYKATALISIGQVLLSKEKYQAAYNEFLDAEIIFQTVEDELSLAYCYCNLGAAKYYLGDYREALELYEKALSYKIYQNNHLATQACAKELAYTYSKLGDDEKAFEYLKDYVLYQDTVLLKENKEVIASIEAKYNSAQKENELKAKEVEINSKTYQRNLLSGGLGLSFLLGSSIIWGLISRSKRDRKIASQDNDLQKQKIQNLEKEKKLLAMSSLLEGQESERIRIAKDLHDGLGGLLTNVRAHFSKIQSEIENLENLNIYNSATQMIDKAYDEVRRISHNLMPADLRVGGLQIAVRQLVHEMRSIHELQTELEFVGLTDDRLDENIELSSYRIIQELTNNILKYANASKVFVQISKFKDELQIVVEDNGKGFDYQYEITQGKGLGLKSIKSRVEQLGGNLDVDSGSKKGSSVTINVPLR